MWEERGEDGKKVGRLLVAFRVRPEWVGGRGWDERVEEECEEVLRGSCAGQGGGCGVGGEEGGKEMGREGIGRSKAGGEVVREQGRVCGGGCVDGALGVEGGVEDTGDGRASKVGVLARNGHVWLILFGAFFNHTCRAAIFRSSFSAACVPRSAAPAVNFGATQ